MTSSSKFALPVDVYEEQLPVFTKDQSTVFPPLMVEKGVA